MCTMHAMSGAGSPGANSDSSEAPRPKPTGTWAGYLIFALCLLVLISLDAEAAYNDSWARFTGIVVVTVAFVIGPTGGVRWLRRALQRRGGPLGS